MSITAFSSAKFELKVESGVSMPWNGSLEIGGSESTELLERNSFRAYFVPTVGYRFSQEHLIEFSLSHFTVNSSFEATGTEVPFRYESAFRQDAISLTYRYILPDLDRFSLQLGVQGRLSFKRITLSGSREYDHKLTDFSFGPAADINLKMNDRVFVGLEISTGLGKGNGFVDIFAGLHFVGPFYYIRVGSRYWSVTNSFDKNRLSLSFVNFGAQFSSSF
ncbi:hypothetical protein [Mesotoga sp. BH458_6_3_2_1]|uniref:hypothetical protein n=1 Tax=Mesotoga sp. BH458_6_3_2_1 TaxID=1437446 RepID=UPI00217CF9B0|nr:hypothetical protein [Mesotoga sp. BH458_6_3_2_1]MDI9369118.1 hypothetical protein [Thermotogota bacterium]